MGECVQATCKYLTILSKEYGLPWILGLWGGVLDEIGYVQGGIATDSGGS